jgi:reverse gyrase
VIATRIGRAGLGGSGLGAFAPAWAVGVGATVQAGSEAVRAGCGAQAVSVAMHTTALVQQVFTKIKSFLNQAAGAETWD